MKNIRDKIVSNTTSRVQNWTRILGIASVICGLHAATPWANAAFKANDDTVPGLLEGTSRVIDVKANDTFDTTDGTRTVAPVLLPAISAAPLHGTVTVQADGKILYKHDASENFTDTFKYKISEVTTLVAPPNTVNTLYSEATVTISIIDVVDPTIATPLTGATKILGGYMVFNAGATPIGGGSGLFYQWKTNGVDIPGQTSSTLYIGTNVVGAIHPLGLTKADAAAYSVRIYNSGGEVLNGPVNLYVGPFVSWGGFAGGPAVANANTNWDPVICTNALEFAVSSLNTVVLKSDRSVAAFGYTLNGVNTVPGAAQVAGSVKQIAVGAYQAAALKQDGTVLAWGSTYPAAIAVPADLQVTHTPYDASKEAVQVSVGDTHMIALMRNGTVRTWGVNYYWETAAYPPGSPARFSTVTEAVQVSAGLRHNVVLLRDGTVLAAGDDSSGQVTVPAKYQNPATANVRKISAGGTFTLVLLNDGTIDGWGSNTDGQLTFPAADPLNRVVDISAGNNHGLALMADGTVKAWGNNTSGKRNVPSGLGKVKAISAFSVGSAVLVDEPYPVLTSAGQLMRGSATVTDNNATVNQTLHGNVLMVANVSGNVPITARWRLNGIDIIGATNTWYFIKDIQPYHAGQYVFVMTNNAGYNLTPFPMVILNADTAPTIMTQPTDKTVREGFNTSFTVSAIGTGDLTYHWYREGALTPGLVPYYSASAPDGATLPFIYATPGMAGKYRVVVTNTSNNLWTVSDYATLTVLRSPIATGLSGTVIGSENTTLDLSFTVSDADTSPLSKLSYSYTSSDETLLKASRITQTTAAVPASGGGQVLHMPPESNKYGWTTVTVTIRDGVAGDPNTNERVYTFQVGFAPVNIAPTITGLDWTGTPEAPIEVTVQQNIDSLPLEFTIGDIETPRASLTLEATSDNNNIIDPATEVILHTDPADGKSYIKFHPTGGLPTDLGRTLITVKVTDTAIPANAPLNNSAIPAKTTRKFFYVTVVPQNTPPFFESVATRAFTIDEDTTAYNDVVVKDGVGQTAWASLYVYAYTDKPEIIANSGIQIDPIPGDLTGSLRRITFTPVRNANNLTPPGGIVTITAVVMDSLFETVATTFTVDVTPVNDVPMGYEDSIGITTPLLKGHTATVLDSGLNSVLANDYDVENDQMHVAAVTDLPTSHGKVTIHDDGTFSYTHDGTKNYTDSFTYQPNDGPGAVHLGNVTTVHIQITQTPDPIVKLQPRGMRLLEESDATFQAGGESDPVASSPGELFYQWYFFDGISTETLVDGDYVSGATSPLLTIFDIDQSDDQGVYWCRIKDNSGMTDTDRAVLDISTCSYDNQLFISSAAAQKDGEVTLPIVLADWNYDRHDCFYRGHVSKPNGSGSSSEFIPFYYNSDVNAIGFTLVYNTEELEVVSGPTAVIEFASDLPAGTTTEAVVGDNGRIGVIMFVPAEKDFGLWLGEKILGQITFKVKKTNWNGYSTVGMLDKPVYRSVIDYRADKRDTTFNAARIVITTDVEAGNVKEGVVTSAPGKVTAVDVAEIQAYVMGKTVPVQPEWTTAPTTPPRADWVAQPLPTIFQRADCNWYRHTYGDGKITVADLVQAKRFLLGFDPIVPAKGPKHSTDIYDGIAAKASVPSVVSVKSAVAQSGDTVEVAVELNAQGVENALAFNLNFDASVLEFRGVVLGSSFVDGTLNTNEADAANGNVSVLASLPVGKSVAAGTAEVVRVVFATKAGVDAQSAVNFVTGAVQSELVSATAQILDVAFEPGQVVILP